MGKKNNNKYRGPKDLVGEVMAVTARRAFDKPSREEAGVRIEQMSKTAATNPHDVNLGTLTNVLIQSGLVASAQVFSEAVHKLLPQGAHTLTEIHAYLTGANHPSKEHRATILHAALRSAGHPVVDRRLETVARPVKDPHYY